MTQQAQDKIVTTTRTIDAPAAAIFEFIADPSRQPEWDGNDNLAAAAPGQRVHGVGEVFQMTLTKDGAVRDNKVVEFEEGRRIAWCPSNAGQPPAGHLWRWELQPTSDGRTRVSHTYDWTHLADPRRIERARATTPEKLAKSLENLAALVEPT